jgi:hypothetical protein
MPFYWTEKKWLWVPATTTSSGAMGNNHAFAAVSLTATNQHARLAFRCPPDFTTIVEASIIVISTAGGIDSDGTESAANWDLKSNYGAVGAAQTSHEETDASTTYNVAEGNLFAVDVSGVLSALDASDYVGIRFSQKTDADTHDVDILGFYLEYT